MSSTHLATLSDTDFRLIAESIAHVVWMTGPDGSTEFLNLEGAMYLGQRATANPTWDWVGLVHPDEIDSATKAWTFASRTNTPFRLEHRLRRFDGDYRWHVLRGTPIVSEHSGVVRWIGTAVDVDDAKGTEADLRMAEQQSASTLKLLGVLQSNAPVGLGFVDRDFRIVYLNERLAAASGLTMAEQLGQTVAAIAPEAWPQLEPVYRQVLDSGEAIVNVEIEAARHAGSTDIRSYLTSLYPVEVDGTTQGLGVVVVDITARKKAEQALRFQAELLAAVGQAVVAVDLERTVIYWNRAAEEMYGWSAAEAIGRKSTDVIPREESPERAEVMLALMLEGKSWSGEYRVTGRDGRLIAVHVTNTPVLGDDGNLVAVIGSSLDITERKAGDEARWRLASIVDGSGDAIFSSTTDGFFTSWNRAAELLFGYTATEVIGQSVSLIAPPERAHEQTNMRDRLNAGGPHERLETERVRKDGTLIDVVITASTTTDEAGNVVGLSVIAKDITERLIAQRLLESSQRRLADAQRTARMGSFEFDVATSAMNWSDEYSRIFGLDPTIVPSRELVMSMVHPDDAALLARAEDDFVKRGALVDLEFRIIRTDSEQRWVRTHAEPELGADGRIVKISGTIMDDTDRVDAERVRRASETSFKIGFEQSAIGAAITDLQGIPVRVNAAMCAILGRPTEDLIGRTWADFGHPDELPLAHQVLSGLSAGSESHDDERRFVQPDGTIVWVLSHVTLVRDQDGTPQYFFAQFQDISERKRMEHDLAHQALHDSLTGLPNRALLNDRLLHGLAGSRRRSAELGVMFLDIDQFKIVNDSLGHGAGDAFLSLAAQRIAGAIRPGDTVARIGGDEFVIVCDDVSALETERIGERVLEALSSPCDIAGHELRITASLGIAISTSDATPESLLRDSDAAMYRAKERGGGRIELFDDTLRYIAKRRFATASALNRALEHDEFTVQYQPVVDLSTGLMVSVEALLRWEHPDHGLIVPADFISVAEETGLIVPIGARVLEKACQDLASWQRDGGPLATKLTVAVNMSVPQLRSPNIAVFIADVLRRTGVDASDLCLELTESVFMEDVDYFERTLTGLKSLGLDLAIDDFGIGYSSLSYLKRFPFDAVKVDRAFVDGLGTDPHDTALVTAIVAMACALGLQVTAEGVETRGQLSCLKSLGVRRAQGFYLAEPASADVIGRLVAESYRWLVD